MQAFLDCLALLRVVGDRSVPFPGGLGAQGDAGFGDRLARSTNMDALRSRHTLRRRRFSRIRQCRQDLALPIAEKGNLEVLTV